MDKKLTLKKETLKKLSAEQLGKVVAGAVADLGPAVLAADYSVYGCNVL